MQEQGGAGEEYEEGDGKVTENKPGGGGRRLRGRIRKLSGGEEGKADASGSGALIDVHTWPG